MEQRIAWRRVLDSQPNTSLEVIVHSTRTGYEIAKYDGFNWTAKHVGEIPAPNKWAPLPLRA